MKDRPIFYMDGATTVCLLPKDNMIVARGIAVHSRFDMFDGAEGRRYAFARAQEASGRQRDCCKIKLDTVRRIDLVHLSLARDRFGEFKGYFHPRLTKTENIIIDQRTNGSNRNRS